MSKPNKFEAAFKTKKPAAAPEAPPEPAKQKVADEGASPHKRPARRGTKHVGGYFSPEVSRQLREIALDEDSSVQALLGEALDMLFQSRRKPTIAKK